MADVNICLANKYEITQYKVDMGQLIVLAPPAVTTNIPLHMQPHTKGKIFKHHFKSSLAPKLDLNTHKQEKYTHVLHKQIHLSKTPSSSNCFDPNSAALFGHVKE